MDQLVGNEPSDVDGLIDCDIHPVLRNDAGLDAYLPKRWVEHIRNFGTLTRAPFVKSSAHPKATPALSRRDSWPPNGGPPGSDLPFMREQHLDFHGVEFGILQILFPNAKDFRDVELGAAVCRALNEWQLAEWTQPEPRLKASIVIPTEDARAAVDEINLRAAHKDFVQVGIMARTLEPFGSRRYWPIFEAALKHDLPIGIHTGGSNGASSNSAGWHSFYAEEHHNQSIALQALLANLVFEGVFETFPGLRIVGVEAGFAWAPSLAWRLDQQWKRLKSERPIVKRLPSEYLKEQVWLTTQPMDEPPKKHDLIDVIDWIGADRLLFATDYPHWDFDHPAYAFRGVLSQRQKQQIFLENARGVYPRLTRPALVKA